VGRVAIFGRMFGLTTFWRAWVGGNLDISYMEFLGDLACCRFNATCLMSISWIGCCMWSFYHDTVIARVYNSRDSSIALLPSSTMPLHSPPRPPSFKPCPQEYRHLPTHPSNHELAKHRSALHSIHSIHSPLSHPTML